MIKKILKNNIFVLLALAFLILSFGYSSAEAPYQVNKAYFDIPDDAKILFFGLGDKISGNFLDKQIQDLINKINNKEINSVSLVDSYFRKMNIKSSSGGGFIPFEIKVAGRDFQSNHLRYGGDEKIFFAGVNQEVPVTIK